MKKKNKTIAIFGDSETSTQTPDTESTYSQDGVVISEPSANTPSKTVTSTQNSAHKNNTSTPSNQTNANTGTSTVTITKGTYHFANKKTSKYLAFKNNELMMSSTPSTWKVERASVGFYAYAGDSDFVLDIHNANITSGNKVKLWETNGYDAQKWKIVINTNGTYSFLSCMNEQYCLGLNGDKTVLQIRDKNNAAQEWYGVATVDNSLQKYISFTSSRGVIDLRLPPNVTSILSTTRLQQWANDIEKAYYSFYELTNNKPFDYIRIEAYKPFTKYPEYLGYVLDGINIIYIDGEFILTDLAKMANRVNDWNFCVLHELGHMFDSNMPWNFESEALTDIKISYVLEKNNAGAELSSTGNEAVRYGKDIMKSYAQMKGDLSAGYDIFACAYKFLEIKEQIGWEPIQKAFHKLKAEEKNYASATRKQKLEAFVNAISQYSGKNIKSYFTATEWNSLLKEVS